MMQLRLSAPFLSLAGSRTAAQTERVERDWTGLWFRLVEDEGEFIGMRGGRCIEDGKISWVFPSHAEHDGLGGFVRVLRDSHPGRAFPVPARKSRMPSIAARAFAVLGLLARKPIPAGAWKGHDTNWQGDRRGPSDEFATSLWDAAATRRLSAKARRLGVPLNSLLMHALADASRPELEVGPEIWMMPVNMRGPVTLPHDTANHAGYLQIEIGDDKSLSAVHARYKASLKRRDHWATWLFLNSSRLLGYAGIRRVYSVQMARFKQRPFTGAFTNLGAWNNVGVWHVAPPVTRTCPFGAGVIICDGKLSLTAEAHPSIAREAGWTKDLMRRWVSILESDL